MLFQIRKWLIEALLQDRHQLILWLPVFLGCGISCASYVRNSFLPIFGISFCVLGLFVSLKRGFSLGTFFFTPALMFFAGLYAMMLKEDSITTSLIQTHTEAPVWVRGTVEDIRAGRKEKKIRLRVQRIEGLKENPKKLNLTYKFKQEKPFEVGDHITLKAKIGPLGAQAIPNGYDFKKQALFQNVGGQGYITYIHKVKKKPLNTLSRFFGHLRQTLTQKILQHLPDQHGAIAAALVTGDTTEIKKTTRQHFVDSGTAHILAISGLHLTLVGGLFFLAFRLLGLFWPPLLLHIPAPKMGALFAVIGTFCYLQISGGRIPSLRAFLSFSLIMLAILINKTPISLRMVTFSATTVLLMYPESLSTPSFQLSFAAVTALVAFYEQTQKFLTGKSFRKRIMYYFCSLFVSSLIASLATLPFIIYHFHKITLHALTSNMIMIPLLSFLIMPLLVLWVGTLWSPFLFKILAFLLTPLIGLMQNTAKFFSGLEGAAVFLPRFGITSFSLIVLGGLFLCLFRSTLRYGGVVLIILGIIHYLLYPEMLPTIFVANQGQTIGLVEAKHLYTNQLRRKTFLSDMWGDYHGIPANKRHRLKDKAHPLRDHTLTQGKNTLIKTKHFTLWLEKEVREKPPHEIDIWISPTRERRPSGYTGLFLGEPALKESNFIYVEGKSLSR